MKIWLVEGSQSLREAIAFYLQTEGHEVVCFSDGMEVLTSPFLRGHELPDVLITDWDMPRVDGVGLLKRLPSVFQAVKIIMVTGGDTSVLKEELAGSHLQPTHILDKSISPTRLLEILEALRKS